MEKVSKLLFYGVKKDEFLHKIRPIRGNAKVNFQRKNLYGLDKATIENVYRV